MSPRRSALLLTGFFSFVLAACSTQLDQSEIFTQAAFGNYSVNVVRQDGWKGGFKGAVVLKNNGGAPVKSFEIKFRLNGNNPVKNSWGGTFSAPNGGGVITLTSPGYLASLARGQSFESGFVAGNAFSGGTVTSLRVNGKVVGGGKPTAPTNPPVPTGSIPSPFNLFTVIDSDVTRSEFGKVKKWYSESGGTQVFSLFTGDEYVGERKHARTEAGQGLKFKKGSEWHQFEARMKLSGKLDYTYTVAQLFAGCCGPQVRIEVRSNGRINMGSRANGNVRISPDADYANGSKTFKIKIRTNGDQFQVYFNNSLKYSGRNEESKQGNNEALYHFRWGVYSNYKMKENLSNTVTEVSRY